MWNGRTLVQLGVVASSTVAWSAAQAVARGGSPEFASRGGEERVDAPSGPTSAQEYPYYAYDGSLTFVRIRTSGRADGFGRFGRRFAGWAHDYPDAEVNLSKILREITAVHARLVAAGGNILTLDDPRLLQFPIAYVSEPDEWAVTEGEARSLREYLLKGGFIIFDDFFTYEMPNLVAQMRHVFPELEFLPLDGSEKIWDSFFSIDPLQVYIEGPRKNGTPQFYGLFVDNDKGKRMLAVAGAGGDIGDLWEWSGTGFYPVDPTSEGFKIGVNYIIYALTH
jgi:hypothetical protein